MLLSDVSNVGDFGLQVDHLPAVVQVRQNNRDNDQGHETSGYNASGVRFRIMDDGLSNDGFGAICALEAVSTDAALFGVAPEVLVLALARVHAMFPVESFRTN